jgi:endo-alpha-1,4-polygalactosaminidase (GH114 family)
MDTRRREGRSVCALCLVGLLCAAIAAQSPVQNWTNYVRIGGYGLKTGNVEAIVRDAQNSLVYGIEVDNDIPGRYESFLDPTEKLKAISDVAQAAHHAGNKAFVYIAGTECITANADKVAHSMMKDHPDWIQRNITGEPALFTAKAAFWIRPGDEDVWVSPYAKDWRTVYMERVRQIAATGIDGIYVDIPYWMTHFEGWENTWASFDDATVAAFREKTGLDAKHDLKLGDFKDTHFRKWIDFRIDTMTEFMREIRENARSVNPQIAVVPEIYPGIEQEATRVGADVYQMYAVVDAIAHEYEFGEGEHMAASRSQIQWFLYQAGMLSFRAFAQGKATWILNYSWDGDKGVDKRDAMKNLAMSIVMAGANFWDAPGHVMGGSNDPATRKEIFAWIAKNEKELYLPRLPMQPVGVYFSPKSRDYDAENFLPSYRGTLVALLAAHREFQVVTPRTLDEFRGKALALPEVGVLNEAERQALKKFADGGGRLIVLGKSATEQAGRNATVLADNPAREYFDALERDFAAASKRPPEALLRALTVKSDIELEAPPTVAANFGMVNGTPHIFLANFTGLVPSKVAVPTAVDGIRVTIPAGREAVLTFVPFLGDAQVVRGQKKGDKIEFVLPAVERGGIAWIAAQN